MPEEFFGCPKDSRRKLTTTDTPMLEKTKGFQIRYYTLKPHCKNKRTVEEEEEEEERDDGYRIVRMKSPRSKNCDPFMEWADNWVNNCSRRKVAEMLRAPSGNLMDPN